MVCFVALMRESGRWGRSPLRDLGGVGGMFFLATCSPLAQLWTSSYAHDPQCTCVCFLFLFWKALLLVRVSSRNVWKVAPDIWRLSRAGGGKAVKRTWWEEAHHSNQMRPPLQLGKHSFFSSHKWLCSDVSQEQSHLWMAQNYTLCFICRHHHVALCSVYIIYLVLKLSFIGFKRRFKFKKKQASSYKL